MTDESTGGEALGEAIRQAGSLGEDGRWDEARELLLAELEDAPEDPALLCWLGIAAQRVGEEGEAFEFFRRCLALEPMDPFLLAAAGSGLAALDDPQAEPALRSAALMAPELPFARLSYGAYLAREGLFAEALAELEAARALAPEDGEVRAELAMALLLAGRRDEGVAELETAAGMVADDSWLRAVLGMALVEVDRMEEAAEALHQAAEDRPEDVEVQVLYALAAAAEGWEDEAWSALARAGAHAESVDSAILDEVEERLEEGADAARALLRDDVGPAILRERLLQRA